MSLEKYIEQVEKSIQKLPDINKVQRFTGQFTEDDLKSVNISNKGRIVLLTGWTVILKKIHRVSWM